MIASDAPSNLFNLHFAYAYGESPAVARFRVKVDDFQVDEDLGFVATGDGEHIYLQVKKTGQNTDWLAKQLASFAGVKANDVGYCGRKDRHAVCSQWFSVYQARAEIERFQHFTIPGVSVLKVTRHSHKLRLGQHAANRFRIVLRDVENIDALMQRVPIVKQGVPNYFGEQRFGHDGNNLHDGLQWLKGKKHIRDKKQRGLILSALRAYVFNTVLSERVLQNNWQQTLAGDTTTVRATGPLWGRGRTLVQGETAELEQLALTEFAELCHFLEHCGLQQERRALACAPRDFQIGQNDNNIQLDFLLGSGEFATTVLRELVTLKNESLSSCRKAPVV